MKKKIALLLAILCLLTVFTACGKEEKSGPSKQITLRIGSYNIKHGDWANLKMETIGEVIKEANLDIVGVQEVDYKTTRVFMMDQPKLLSEATGLQYYAFCPATDYKGGQYGTLILSKYPIVSHEVIPLESGDSEKRALGHAVIDVDGWKFDFFNTHLSNNSAGNGADVRSQQFDKIAEYTKKCSDFIVTADFNTSDFSAFAPVGGNLINNEERFHGTHSGGEKSIDNIVYSDIFKEVSSGTVTESYSDHYMLWAEFEAG